ncbi:hypothetical protein [Bibersteinia trehalosi]|uniref:hypothetical protein n=1 Tax=Bibersteinia trehalosi TaxID=47735 RepID=UPI00046D6E07|nr:hypothetical protein [Bibersteinia trehalosi]
MKKFIVFLLIIISYKLYYHKVMIDIETRADYIIELMEEYKSSTGGYPTDVDDILATYYADYMMVDSKDIPGKGFFIIYDGVDKDEYGNILVVGGWNPPNVIYFPKIKKKEINSTYFSSKF